MSDFPDWSGQPYFPRYGAAYRTGDIVTVGAASTETIIEIDGMGIFYHGEIYTDPGRSHKDDVIRFYVDNNLLTLSSLYNLLITPRLVYLPGQIILDRYDEVDYRYHVFVMGVVTFTDSIKLTWENNAGAATDVTGYIAYTKK